MRIETSWTVAKPKYVLAAIAFVAAVLMISAIPSAAPASGGIGTGGGDKKQSSGGGSGTNMTPAKYERKWDRASARNKRWAHRVAQCETGRDPNATALGGRYRGAYMFTRDAWRIAAASPGGDPIDYSYLTQSVVALSLKRELGTGPWPECG